MNHVVLLGDSIFDNARYVPGGSPVIEQLRAWLPRDWRATLLAVDGAIASSVTKQLQRLPPDATHLVISAGGNNALENSGMLDETALSAAEGFATLAETHQRFRQEYREMLQSVLALERPITLCTIYDAIPGLSAAQFAALSVFNDVILREGIRKGLPLLDLRLICDEARDYSSMSPIEPSEVGGSKIVRGIRRIVTGHDFNRAECVVYGN